MYSLKVCSKCKKQQDINNFGLDNARKDKLNPWCNRCRHQKYEKRYSRVITITDTEFTCRQCNKALSISEFRETSQNNRGFCYSCKSCESKAKSEKYSQRYTEKRQQYRKTHQEKHQESNARRRALKKDTAVEVVDFEQIKQEYLNSCAYCFRNNTPLTMDHMIPLSRGGKHIRENIIPACQSCNSKKYNKTAAEFMRVG